MPPASRRLPRLETLSHRPLAKIRPSSPTMKANGVTRTRYNLAVMPPISAKQEAAAGGWNVSTSRCAASCEPGDDEINPYTITCCR